MSIESKLEALTAAVLQLTQVIAQERGNVETSRSISVPQPAAPAQPPVAPVAAAPVAAPAAAPQMPALPTFAAAPAPAAAPAANAAPFNDTQGLIQYTMGAYQAMGPEKGAKIQSVLQSLGYANINDVKPEHFAQFHQGVEALKAGA
jgi:hypothetical protein